REFESITMAVEYASQEGGEMVKARAQDAGAENVEVVVERDDMRASMGSEWGGDVLLETRLLITAVGKPRQFHEVGR
ncbi:MAG TPA: hydantoinase/oxoprolinase family protein, partial [Methanomassiliicoccales archaeon]|nr:hydantoinase/oxoprolinase family protein [Methanomassiliicoccales archaeon]